MGFILFFIIVLMLVYMIPWIGYMIYYKPIYTIFRNQIYIPFYLYLINCSIIFCILMLSILLYVESYRVKIIMSIILFFIFYFIYRNIIRDIIIILNEKYKSIECDLDTLSINNVKTKYFYEISSVETVNSNNITIRMDFYQYHKLLKMKLENKNNIVIVYFLPNTRKMLNKKVESIKGGRNFA